MVCPLIIENFIIYILFIFYIIYYFNLVLMDVDSGSFVVCNRKRKEKKRETK